MNDEVVKCPDCGNYFDGCDALQDGCPVCLEPESFDDSADRHQDKLADQEVK